MPTFIASLHVLPLPASQTFGPGVDGRARPRPQRRARPDHHRH